MMKRQRYMGGRYKRRGLRKQCNEEGYTEKRMRVVKEKEERERERERITEQGRKRKARIQTIVRKESGTTYVFSEGGSSVVRRGPRALRKKETGDGKREREKEARKGKAVGYT